MDMVGRPSAAFTPLYSTSTLVFPPGDAASPRSPESSNRQRYQSGGSAMDPLLTDISPVATLEALRASDVALPAADGKRQLLRESISVVSPSERAFGIKAAIASKKLREWCAELQAWPWPSARFEPPFREQRRADGTKGYDGPDGGEKAPTSVGQDAQDEYWGSLPAATVQAYDKKLGEIQDEMEGLELEELKNYVRTQHVLLPAYSSASSRGVSTDGSRPSTYNRLDSFTVMITTTIMQSLPFQSHLSSLMELWGTRGLILRRVPSFLHLLDTARDSVKTAWDIVDGDYTVGQGESSSDLSRAQAVATKQILDTQVAELGSSLDNMLDMLEGQSDRIPDAWIDSMEGLQEELQAWVVEAERVVEENELAALRSNPTSPIRATHTTDNVAAAFPTEICTTTNKPASIVAPHPASEAANHEAEDVVPSELVQTHAPTAKAFRPDSGMVISAPESTNRSGSNTCTSVGSSDPNVNTVGTSLSLARPEKLPKTVPEAAPKATHDVATKTHGETAQAEANATEQGHHTREPSASSCSCSEISSPEVMDAESIKYVTPSHSPDVSSFKPSIVSVASPAASRRSTVSEHAMRSAIATLVQRSRSGTLASTTETGSPEESDYFSHVVEKEQPIENDAEIEASDLQVRHTPPPEARVMMNEEEPPASRKPSLFASTIPTVTTPLGSHPTQKPWQADDSIVHAMREHMMDLPSPLHLPRSRSRATPSVLEPMASPTYDDLFNSVVAPLSRPTSAQGEDFDPDYIHAQLKEFPHCLNDPEEPQIDEEMAREMIADHPLYEREPAPSTKNLDGRNKSFNDQLTERISTILTSVPMPIELLAGPEHDAIDIRRSSSAPSSNKSDSISRPKSRAPRFFSRSKTLSRRDKPPTAPVITSPTLKLAPAIASKSRPHQSSQEIKLYHLYRPGKAVPIKLYIRLVGDSSERVMVRVGGGWADLAAYLQEYAAHHGGRSVSGKHDIEVKDLDMGSTRGLPDSNAGSGRKASRPSWHMGLYRGASKQSSHNGSRANSRANSPTGAVTTASGLSAATRARRHISMHNDRPTANGRRRRSGYHSEEELRSAAGGAGAESSGDEHAPRDGAVASNATYADFDDASIYDEPPLVPVRDELRPKVSYVAATTSPPTATTPMRAQSYGNGSPAGSGSEHDCRHGRSCGHGYGYDYDYDHESPRSLNLAGPGSGKARKARRALSPGRKDWVRDVMSRARTVSDGAMGPNALHLPIAGMDVQRTRSGRSGPGARRVFFRRKSSFADDSL